MFLKRFVGRAHQKVSKVFNKTLVKDVDGTRQSAIFFISTTFT